MHVLVVGAALLSAAPARADLRSQLVGEWNRTYGTALRFSADGKCMVAHNWTTFDKPAARCSWTLEGDRLTMTNYEGLCSDKVEDHSGTYTVVIKEPAIKFRVVRDHCPRRTTIDGQTWTRVDRTRPPTAAPAAMDSFKSLAGSWQCVSRDSGDPNDTGLRSRLLVEPEYDGWWQSLQDDFADKSGYHAAWGWDAERQQVVVLGREPLGAWFELASPGWKGESIVFTGDVHSGLSTSPMRWTIKRSASELVLTFEKQIDGAWGTESVERCQP